MGKCIGCKADKATQWANRCEHEAKRYAFNTFITLTYDDNNLPDEGWLEPDELAKFFKRLRRKAEYHGDIERDNGSPIRYFACGEYGTKYQRPHYHAILFGTRFADQIKIGERNGKPVYHSDILRETWGKGNVQAGAAEPGGANYIAQYALKSIRSHKGEVNSDGVWRPAPFLRMSTRGGGIGALWLDDNQNDLRRGYLVTPAGRKRRIPRTYLNRIKERNPSLYEEIEYNIAKHARGDASQHLEAAERIHIDRNEKLSKRSL